MSYDLKRNLKINGMILSTFFEDNETPPLFSLQDCLKIIFKDYNRNVTRYAERISDEHKQKISLGHTSLWCVDLEGFCTLARENLEEPETVNILKEINKAILREQETLPSPVKNIELKISDIGFKKITFQEKRLDYILRENDIEYRLKDLERIYGTNIVKKSVKILDPKDIRHYDTEIGRDYWISDNGLMDLLCVMDISSPIEDYEEIHKLVSEEEKISGTWKIDDSVLSMIIDGDKTDSSRYQKFSVEDIRCVAYNTGDRVLIYFNVEDVCRVQSLNKEKGKRAAIYHSNIIFFSEGDEIYTTLFGVDEIMKHLRKKNHEFTVNLIRKSSDIADKMTWNLQGEVVRVLRHDLEIKENDTMSPVQVQGLDLVVLKAAELEVNGKTCWILQSKTKDFTSDTMPLFVVKPLGDILGFTRGREVIKKVPTEEVCQVTIPGFRKHNAYTVTRAGLKILGKSVGADPSVVEQIEKVADSWIAETQEDIKFAVQMELTRETEQAKTVVDITPTEESREEVEEATEFEFSYENVMIRGAAREIEGVLMTYYDKEDLSKIFTVMNTPTSYLNGRDMIALNNLATAIGKDNFNKIFIASKAEYEKVVEKIVKNKEPERDMMYNYLSSQSTEAFILGAIMLAERLRNVTVWLRVNGKRYRTLAGPSSNNLLNELWKHIDCQDYRAPISFGFRKLVTATTARYEALRDMIRFQQKK